MSETNTSPATTSAAPDLLLPRASKLQLLYECPGALRMQRLVTDEAPSAAAAHGELLHRRVDPDQSLDGLYADDREAVEEGRAALAELIQRHDAVDIAREVSLPITVAGRVVISGHCDWLMRNRDGSLTIVDFKFGKISVTPADKNMQMMAYAVGAAEREGAQTVAVHCYIVAPLALNQKRSSVSWDAEALEFLRLQVLGVAERCARPELVLCPGLHCRNGYCSAIGICPATAELQGPVESDAQALKQGLGPQALRLLYERWLTLEKRGHIIVHYFRNACAKGLIPGWCIKDTRGHRVITDSGGAYGALSDLFPTQAEFLPFMAIKVAELEAEAAKRMKTKGMCKTLVAGKAEYQKRLARFVSYTPSSRRIYPADPEAITAGAITVAAETVALEAPADAKADEETP